MNKQYTYSHILFAIRQEYINIQKQKDIVKQYIKKSKIVEDYCINLTNSRNSNVPLLFLEFEIKEKIIHILLESLLNYSFDNERIFDITDGFNQNYRYNEYKKNKFYFNITNEKELNKIIKKIMNSEFVKEQIKAKNYILPITENGEKYLVLNSSCGLKFVDAQNPYYDKTRYNLYSDKLFVESQHNNICPSDIKKVLDYNVDISKLNSYYHNLFENFQSKEIVVDSHFNSKNISLSIFETSKEYVLSNKR